MRKKKSTNTKTSNNICQTNLLCIFKLITFIIIHYLNAHCSDYICKIAIFIIMKSTNENWIRINHDIHKKKNQLKNEHGKITLNSKNIKR